MRYFLIIMVLFLAACSSSRDERKELATSKSEIEDKEKKDKDETSKDKEPEEEEEEGNLLFDTISDTFYGAIDTVKSPFKDLGFMQSDIPEQLQEVSSNPYVTPASAKCDAIMEELSDLDTILGADKFSPKMALKNAKEVSYWAEGAKMSSNFAISKLGSKVNIIPLRGLVRKVSGAEKHDKAVKKAFEAGQLRRAYLRGMADAQAMNCKKTQIVKKESGKEVAKAE